LRFFSRIQGRDVPELADICNLNAEKVIAVFSENMGPKLYIAQAKGVCMYMTLQTIWGYVHMFVYDTGRNMMAKGIIPTGNMLPEVAFIKLGWALGQTEDPEEVKKLMLTPINDDITIREPYNGYLVYQGGIPELEEFVRKVHK